MSKGTHLYITVIIILSCFTANSQRINPHKNDVSTMKYYDKNGANLSNDTSINIINYSLEVEISLDSPHISGMVDVGLISLKDSLTSFRLDLLDSYIIDSISEPSSSYLFEDNVITINLGTSVNNGDYLDLSIYYHGIPELAGGYKGLRYETHDNNELIIASLSTPYLAHTWWPCKDGTQDKADSVFVSIIVKDTLINQIPVAAISNGILDTIIDLGDKKKFEWKHKYPIVPYYVMVAISNYREFNDVYVGDGYNFPLDYYVFESHIEDAEIGVEDIPDAIDYFTTIFGPYPFKDEKYGMTQLGFYGAIENQTNSITNNMGLGWFYVSIHELAHMWFADMITCNTWHHGWLNEGFATYAEALYSGHKNNNYKEYIENFEYYEGGTVYLDDVSNPFTVFQPIIYNKGAYVLHMLRGVVGDSIFFDIIYDYATNDDLKYKLATTEQFQNISENVSGFDLGYFFDQWIYDERYPMYYYNYKYDEVNNKAEVVINQNQGLIGWREVFEMPIKLLFTFADDTDTTITVINSEIHELYSINFDMEVVSMELDPDNWILKTAVFDPNIIVGTESNRVMPVSIFPNPSKGNINFHFKNISYSDNVNVSIYNLVGQRIEFESMRLSGSRMIVGGLNPGIYLVSLSVGNNQYFKKIIVQ